MKDWYDGYVVSDIIPPDPNHEELKTTGQSPAANRYALYSPLSAVESMTTGVIKDYWNKTETYEALAEYIRKDYDGLKEAGKLLQSGLGIDGYDSHTSDIGHWFAMTRRKVKTAAVS